MNRRAFSGTKLTILLTWLLVSALSLSFAEMADKDNSQIYFGCREIIVEFKSDVYVGSASDRLTGIYSVDSLNERHGVAGIEKIFVADDQALSNFYKLSFSTEVDVPSVIEEYCADPNVKYAEPNYVGHAALVPNDARYSCQWAHSKMQSELAWNITTGNSCIVIAVIDTGVDWDHPDLASNIWINPDDMPNGIDDDGNGYVDDLRGWDFVHTTYPVWPGEDGTIRDNDPMDFHGHGTHVAGIAAAVTNNSIGIAGMSWASKIMSVRAGYKAPDGGSWFWWSDVAPAIKYAADNGANIISMSFGGYGFSSLLKSAVDYAYAKGVFLVAAAMNDNISTRPYPAGFGNVAAVAATNSTDGKAWFSNYGAWVDVAAPGVDIASTLFDDTYALWSGTSMSTPYVAGLAALILSENLTLTNTEVRNVILKTTDPVTSSVYIGTGRVNAYKACLRAAFISRPDAILYVDGFTAELIQGDINRVGMPPYLDVPNDGNYIEGTAHCEMLAWFSFEDLTLGDAEIKEVVLEGYTDGLYNELVEYDVYTEDDFTWLGSLYATGESAWVAPRWTYGQTVDELYPAILNKDELNGLQILVHFYDPLGYGAGPILDALRLKVWVYPISVHIDIKPGSDPNSISMNADGLLPVAILGEGTFDVSNINVSTIELGGIDIASRGSFKAPKIAYSFEDVNGDGYTDLMAFFSKSDLIGESALTEMTTVLALTANLQDGTPIEGTDSVRVVPP